MGYSWHALLNFWCHTEISTATIIKNSGDGVDSIKCATTDSVHSDYSLMQLLLPIILSMFEKRNKTWIHFWSVTSNPKKQTKENAIEIVKGCQCIFHVCVCVCYAYDINTSSIKIGYTKEIIGWDDEKLKQMKWKYFLGSRFSSAENSEFWN